ncbi:MAG: amidohydrolase family protein [Psychrobium sp.]|nr:amidohydrolase family protein [Psychrobium sp.]
MLTTNSVLIIDSHLHLFDLKNGDYGWLKPQNPPNWPDKALIHRDFSVTDLALDPPMKLAGFVHIEAGYDNEQPWREIAWLQGHVTTPFKSIAAIDLTQDEEPFLASIATLKGYDSVVGVRHMLDEQAQTLLSAPLTLQNLRRLADTSLIFETQLSGIDDVAIDLLVVAAKQIPTLTIILSHANFAPTAPELFEQWQGNIKKLAACRNIFFKASGWEMVDRDYTMRHVAQSLNVLLAFFGADRVMLASNFPLCLFSKSYSDFWQDYQQLGELLPLSAAQLNALQYGNSKRVYQF